MIRASDKKLILDFEELVDVIKSTTSIDPFESAGDKAKRIKYLLRPGGFRDFCAYYFPEYCFAPFGWFHKEVPEELIATPNSIWLLQWSREFTKSTTAGLFIPLHMKATGNLNSMIVGSLNENVAAEKLMDIQANLESNQRYINDFGDQQSWGNWEDGAFKTKDGTAFYGFGKRQSPRGTRFKWKRPNYGLIDDLNDSRQLKNKDIAEEDKRWVMEEFKPALWIKKWWMVVAQNKFHDYTVTALIEDDEEINAHVSRINIKDENGNSNWPENFTNEDIKNLEESEGGGFIRERMNTPFEEGRIFKNEWLHWTEPLPFDKYDGVLINYLDPSYKATDKSDYKFWVLIGKTGTTYHVLKAWGERTTSKKMWETGYDFDEYVGDANIIKHAMEAGFIQEEMHSAELDRVEEDKGRPLRLQYDYRDKPNKFERIESLQPLFQRGKIRFNILQKGDTGMKLLRSQLLAFEKGSNVNDDGPDALEGAIWMINKYGAREGNRKARSGKYKSKSNRSI